MGTSAVIKIEGITWAELYKHFDGYPESTLPWLESFNKDFTKNRGNDPEYKFAQLIRSSVRDGGEFDLDMSKYTGWGVVKCKSYYGDYTYILKSDGSVTVE